jgi:cytochrome c oxidase cbb3-type subunit I/II
VVWVIFTINCSARSEAPRETHVRGDLVLHRHRGHGRRAAHRQLAGEVPAASSRATPIYAGVQDALVQWWYGHNAVAFFLTTPYLGLMYYFLPKAADRPVFSYRLSIIHFWALIFLYIWAGPHHLLYTALPDWAQSLGMVFSVMLVAPSWGGMLNGLLTLRGAWDKVRQDPMLKFMVVAVTAYGMATLEGPHPRHQERQFPLPLHRLDHRPRAYRRARLERLPHLQHALLADSRRCTGPSSTPTSWPTTTSGSGCSA